MSKLWKCCVGRGRASAEDQHPDDVADDQHSDDVADDQHPDNTADAAHPGDAAGAAHPGDATVEAHGNSRAADTDPDGRCSTGERVGQPGLLHSADADTDESETDVLSAASPVDVEQVSCSPITTPSCSPAPSPPAVDPHAAWDAVFERSVDGTSESLVRPSPAPRSPALASPVHARARVADALDVIRRAGASPPAPDHTMPAHAARTHAASSSPLRTSPSSPRPRPLLSINQALSIIRAAQPITPPRRLDFGTGPPRAASPPLTLVRCSAAVVGAAHSPSAIEWCADDGEWHPVSAPLSLHLAATRTLSFRLVDALGFVLGTISTPAASLRPSATASLDLPLAPPFSAPAPADPATNPLPHTDATAPRLAVALVTSS